MLPFFFEILSNSIDEFREGRGDKIYVTLFQDHSIEVQDFGQGIPVEFNEKENAYNWELLFCEMYAGGKYNNEEELAYSMSLGMNGLGLCATQYASEYMDAEIYRDGYKYELHFQKGNPVEPDREKVLIKTPEKHKSGSRIRWRPDGEVFTDINIPIEYFREILNRQTISNGGLTIEFRYQNEDGSFSNETYLYPDGIGDCIRAAAGDDALTEPQRWQTERKGRDAEDRPEYRLLIDLTFCFSNKNKLLNYYHNSSFLEHGGSPDKAVRNAFVYAIDSYLKSTNKYTKNESKINFNDIEESLIFISNCHSNIASYENQTKKAVTNKFIQEAMTEFLRHQLEVYFVENKQEADKIADQILINKRSRENAEKARLNIKKKLTADNDLANRVEKFVDCRSKDPAEREIYIVEGDSALGSCKLARDARFQAIIPVRGKILNCLKADYNQIFKNDIITDIIKVLGCGVEISAKSKNLVEFNLDNLRFDKIIICTDADVDGYQIRTLILTMIYRLMPTLIAENKVYIAESPLYEITCKDKTYFAYTDKEKNDITAKLTGKVSVQRSKGLGENEPEMMKKTTMDPATRKLLLVTPEEIERTAWYFDVLLGNNLQGRKEFIAENGYKYLELADIS